MENFKKLLKELIAFKSISTDSQYQDQVDQTAEWIANLFQKNGFKTEIIKGYDNPVVFASYEVSSEAETVLVYGHYDVQPAGKQDGWDSEPFELTEKDGKLIARGVVDNKGQFLIHAYSVLELIKQNQLKYNIRFLIEGNEETGSGKISGLLKERKELFKADHVLISDGEMPYKPMVTTSFRGILNTTIRYKTANNNLHSGLYGGAVPNAAEELSRLISKLNDPEYLSGIIGFYEKDSSLSSEDILKCQEIDKSRKDVLGKTGIKKYFSNNRESFTATTGFKSMHTVTGFKSGYTGEGYSNIVPNLAEAKINFRIAWDQDPEDIFNKFSEFIRNNTPEYVEFEIDEPAQLIKPIKVDLSLSKHQETIRLLEKVYKKEVLIDYCGAIIPIVGDFQEILGTDPLLVSLANDDCNMHGVNENYDIGLIEKGLEFSKEFFKS